MERQRLDWELSNLVSAVAAGGDSPSLVVEIRRREARRAELDRQLSRTVLDEGDLRKALERRLQDWKGLLRSQPVHGQTVLRILLDGPILIGAEQADGVSWEAQANLEGLLGTLSHQVASPISASWNQLKGWLCAVESLRRAA